MARRPVLKNSQRTVEQQFLQDKVADPTCLLRRPNSRLLQCLSDSLDAGTIDNLLIELLEARTVALPNRRHNARSIRSVPQADVVLGITGKPTDRLWVGDENERFNEGYAFAFERLLPREKRFEPFALAVREENRVFDGFPMPLVGPSPVPGIPGQFSRLPFKFDEKNALRTRYEQIDLIDRPIVGNKLKVRPSPVIVLRRKPLEHKVERLLLPLELGAGDCFPVLFLIRHF